MIKRIALTLLCATVLYCGTFAQDENYKKQYASGYRGGYIKNISLQENALDFLVVGDWGRQGEYYQTAVANQMANAAVSMDLDFVISTGDNFYPDGVGSDLDPQWKYSFEDVYKHFSLQKKWYVVLGNHDYRSNPEAQIAYSKISRRWQMPARYYSKQMVIDDDSTNQVLFIFLDTSPFVSKYYNDDIYGPQIRTQDTVSQISWLKNVLQNRSGNVKWTIVVGHHPLFAGGKRLLSQDTREVNERLKPVFDEYKVDIYLCGHEHTLEYIKPAGATHYFTSGAGSEVRPVALFPDGGKFAASKAGFLSVSIVSTQMMIQVINSEGKILFKQQIRK